MDDCLAGTDERLKCTLDELLASLNQHLKPNVIGRAALLDQTSIKRELRVRSRRKSNLNLLKTALNQGLKKLELLTDVHWDCKRLVPIPQIHAAPNWGSCESSVRPTTIHQLDRRKGPILSRRVFEHVV